MILSTLFLLVSIVIGIGFVSHEVVPPYQTSNLALNEWRSQGQFYTMSDRHIPIKMFYREIISSDAKSADTLVLIHGFPTSSIDFRHALPHLSSHFARIILFDHIGFGLSDKPPASDFGYSITEYTDAMLNLLQFLNVTSAHYLSHDLGDSVLTELAARYHRQLLPHWFKSPLSLTFTNGMIIIIIIIIIII